MVVVVVHISPEHGSNIDAILGRVTPMPVRQVRQSVPIASDYVYVISPAQQRRWARQFSFER